MPKVVDLYLRVLRGGFFFSGIVSNTLFLKKKNYFVCITNELL